jgi:hypothetical protein
MSWYPGKYAAKAAEAMKRAAKEAVEVGKTAIKEGPAAAKKRTEQSLAAAYAEAERAWTEARDEALEALGKAGQLQEFEDKARSIAKRHEKLIVLARDTAVEISLEAYEVIAKKLLAPGKITTEDQALNLMQQVYGPSQSARKLQAATKEASESEGLRTLSVCNNAAAGFVVGVEGAGLGLPPILRHDFNRWLPVPYREGAVAFGGIVSASAGVSVGVFKRAANKQWGNFIKITWAADAEGPGAHVSISFSLQDGEFDGFDVGLEVAGGSQINIYASVGRTIRLPLLYPTKFYD